MNAVQFGAGNIGRGFLGQLYSESGFHTTFIEAMPNVVDALNRQGRYTVTIAEEQVDHVEVTNVSAILATDLDAVADAVAQADIVSTAVGVNVLPRIAPALADGLARRFAASGTALDVIVCENLIHAGPFLREQVRQKLGSEWHPMLEEKIGFVEASIGRMVPIVAPEVRANDPLYVEVEAYSELPVDGDAFRAPIPAIRNLKPISPFQAYVERKLYVHNAGHAATAYLGWLKGYEFIWQAIQDRTIRSVVFDAMTESCRGLAKRFSMSEVALEMHRDDLLRRFGNRALGDQIVRVAADPIRKLGPEDRFFGAISMCLELGIPPVGLVKGVAAALQFDNPKDEAAMALQTRLREQGIDAVIRSMAPSEAVAEVVLEAISR